MKPIFREILPPDMHAGYHHHHLSFNNNKIRTKCPNTKLLRKRSEDKNCGKNTKKNYQQNVWKNHHYRHLPPDIIPDFMQSSLIISSSSSSESMSSPASMCSSSRWQRSQFAGKYYLQTCLLSLTRWDKPIWSEQHFQSSALSLSLSFINTFQQ